MILLQVNTTVGIDRPLFRAFPPVLAFQGYEVGQTLEATLCLRNEDQASQLTTWLDPQEFYHDTQRYHNGHWA